MMFYVWLISEVFLIRYLNESGIPLKESGNCLIADIILFCLLKIFFKHYKKHRKKKRYLKSSIRKIDAMSGEDFERLLATHFEKAGYKVTLTPTSNDYGADLILKKKGKTTVLQAKRYKGKVSNSAIQEIVAAMPYYNADHAMVVTNSYFTNNAKVLAEANQVELWDRTQLIKNFHVR